MWKHSMALFSDEYLFEALNEMEDELRDLFISYARTKVLKKKIEEVKEELKKRGY